MVDITEETINLSTDRTKIIAFIILQRQTEVVSAIEEYEGIKLLNPRASRNNKVKSSILGLWYQVRSNVRFSNKELFDEITDLLKDSSNFDNFMLAFDKIDEFLCNAKLTRFIHKSNHNPNSSMEVNKARGLL